MKINLTDNIPVQKKYNSIPKPLYPEVKQYIEDLLNRKFIRKSKSAYSSPVVCVRKKDATLRLCVDYRELNRQTIADRHPLPKVQTTLENIGGSETRSERQKETITSSESFVTVRFPATHTGTTRKNKSKNRSKEG
jgi:hypothetical protein